MNTSSIRKQLHNYLEVADYKKIKAIYVMMEKEIRETSFEYSDELKTELDKRSQQIHSGKAKLISAKDSKRRISKLLNAARKK